MEEASKTGVGAIVGGVAGGIAGGAVAGAAVGGVTGPVGAVVGAAVGAAVGAVTCNVIDDNAVAGSAYWRLTFNAQPDVANPDYDHYSPAYMYGLNAHDKYPDRSFDEVEPELRSGWADFRGSSPMEWQDARPAARHAWQRTGEGVEHL